MWFKGKKCTYSVCCSCFSPVEAVIALKAFPLECFAFALLSWVISQVEMITDTVDTKASKKDCKHKI